MPNLNNANKTQRLIMRELSNAAWDCPPSLQKEAFDKYQAEVLQPIRDRILAAADKKETKL
jgi:hypothetical protein